MSRSSEYVSPWSFRVATVSGIPIRLHFTFVLFLLYLIMVGYTSKEDAKFAILVPGIFVCVVLHELGHALTAQRFGIRTKDITLYPIGGVAALAGRPKAVQEFWIALAGPAVNVLIALILGILLVALNGKLPPFRLSLLGYSVLEGLFVANVVLPVFNMIPAFPMDGGRVLRALLAMWLPETQATQIAGGIGQLLAIGFGVFGLITFNVFLMLIAFFVFLGAGQEVSATVGFSLVSGSRVSDAMMTNFRSIPSNATLDDAAKLLLEGSQQDFPVVFEGEVLGVLNRDDLLRGMSGGGFGDYVAGHMRRDYKRLPPEEPLENALELFLQTDRSPILVMEDGRLVGMLTVENLSEYMMLRQAGMTR